MEKRQYIADLKRFYLFFQLQKNSKKKKVFSVIQKDLVSAYCIGGYPFLLVRKNTNYKRDFYIGPFHAAMFSRRPPEINKAKQETGKRNPRVYISLGSLVFFDQFSGVPRVTKKLCEEGLKSSETVCLPVYPDPETGKYRIACGWCRNQGFELSANSGVSADENDPEITVGKGDWLVHSMTNIHEFEFFRSYYASFRQNGGKVGFILHDILPVEHPEYFRKHDAAKFHRCLEFFGQYDGILAVSEATKNSYLSWCQKYGKHHVTPVRAFCLGSEIVKGSVSIGGGLPVELKGKDYFLQISTLEPRKGYSQLLDAFDYLWGKGLEISLVIIGKKGWKAGSLCHRIGTHPQLHKKLFWFKNADDQQLLAILKYSKALIMASEAEGFGLPIVEAAQNNKRAIVRDIPVFREVGNASTVYFSGKDGIFLAGAIEKFLSEPAKDVPRDSYITWSKSFSLFFNELTKF